MNEAKRDDIPKVSVDDNDMLTAPFTKMEVNVALFQKKRNKSPGSDGFLTEFY